MGEVDQFLDEVEAELERLHKENDDLRAKLVGRPGTATPAPVAPRRRSPSGQADEPVKAPKPEPAGRGRRRAGSRRADQGHHRRRGVLGRARLLELATRNADELVAEAKDEADKILGEARTKAERLEAETKAKARRARAGRPHPRRRSSTPRPPSAAASCSASSSSEKGNLDGEVEDLRAFEREYRSRLKSYFEPAARRPSTAAATGGDAAAHAADGERQGRATARRGQQQHARGPAEG